MCYGDFCKTVDPDLPIYCPECLALHFRSLTEEDLYEMYIYFENESSISKDTKQVFFEAFNRLMLIKREQLDDGGDNNV